MENQSSIKRISARGLVLRGNDIDTDRIIPARFLKCVTFDGLGANAFFDERFDEAGRPKPHPFNDPLFAGAGILVVNANFGCGSSREHAPQALYKYGIKAVIGESFAEIFAGNCLAMGLPTVQAGREDVLTIMTAVEADPAAYITIDLDAGEISMGTRRFPVTINEAARRSLLSGDWDTIGVLLSNKDAINARAAQLPYMRGFV